MTGSQLLYSIAVGISWIVEKLDANKNLFTARFAYLYERMVICISKAEYLSKLPVILLGRGQFEQFYAVRPTTQQKELENAILYGKTRIGKGLNIVANLLRWPYPTIVNDIKGELWDQTAGWREQGLAGRSLLFDPRGTGHKFDPFAGKQTDFDLRSAATILLHRPHEGQNAVFTERAITMLVQIFHAARLEKQRTLPFTYKIFNEGLFGVATILKIIADKYHAYPHLATKFLDTTYETANFDSKFLQDCYSTMTARINNILTKESVRCFMGSDFTARDIMTSGNHPISLYLSWPEKDLLALSPLIELVWDSLITDMTDAYDLLKGAGCSRTLLILDEIFRTGMHKLPEYATTVCGRNMSLFISAQSRSQLDAAYGMYNATKLRGQIDSIVYYRPAPDDYETMAHIERLLGYQSGFAASKNEHDGGMTTGESEQKIPLIPAHETELMKATQVIVKRSGVRPVLAERLDWRRVPELVARHRIPPPKPSELPHFEETPLDRGTHLLSPSTSWQLPPELIRRGRSTRPTHGSAKKWR